MSGLAEMWFHISEYARHPRSIGAVAPSSRQLAEAMASIVPGIPPRELIVELGAGTGAITGAIRAAWPGHRIVAVDKNPRLAARLRKRFPDVEVVQGCVTETLQAMGGRAGLVMSGLPMLSFDEPFRMCVLQAIHQSLAPGGFFVQFTYVGRAWRGFSPAGFRLVDNTRVLRNVPPATILCFQKTPAAAPR